jgi:catechol 2,3-dioxygenase-like lactoylglutathione lyase family enzyme
LIDYLMGTGDMFKINALRSITLRTTKKKECERYYSGPWGLIPIHISDERTLFRGTDSEHHVLELLSAEDTGLDKLCLSVASRDEVISAAEVVEAAGYDVLSPPGELASLGGGFGFTTRDPDGNAVGISSHVKAHPVIDDQPFLLERISHMLLNTPDVTRMAEFYVDTLGFAISDRYENDAIIFLRCNEAHHCLVLGESKTTGIQHIAFDVRDYDALMHGVGRLRRAGLDPLWGVGRHGPGGNIFAYFADPNGYVVEITCELLHPSDDYEPQTWVRSVENGDVWGSAGAPSDEIKRLWSGDREEFELSSTGGGGDRNMG